MRKGVLGAVGLALVAASCFYEPLTDVIVTTYEVTGTSRSALEQSLATHGPVVPGLQGRAFAAVEPRFLHSFEARQNGNICRYGREGRVGLRATVILPEWRQRENAPAELREQWDIISTYAVIHERGHIEISQRYARIMEHIYRGASAPDCDALKAKIARHAEDIYRHHRAAQRRFDETDGPRFEKFLQSVGYTLRDVSG
ncbi:MAG: DUF922 domain-containing protein [Pseudomonadota bacterium]